jgi:hypothetical protein
MTAKDVLDAVNRASSEFGATCGKFKGAFLVEFVRGILAEDGLNVSSRDVYIRGVPVEFDLLVLKPGAQPNCAIFYDPSDVLAAIEVKNSGAFGEQAIVRLKECFLLVKACRREILCVYLTLEESVGCAYAPRDDKTIGGPAYTLLWWHGVKKGGYEDRGDWSRFLGDMRALKKRRTVRKE